MGYRVKKHHTKRGWKLLFEWYENGVRKTRGVPEIEWREKGFHLEMTREQAFERASSINAQSQLLQHEKRRNKIADRIKGEHLVQLAFLPKDLLTEFEERKLDMSKPKLRSYWNCARAILAEVRLEPKDWDDNPKAFFQAFIRREMSPSYVRQVLPLINLWGKFVAKRTNSFFSPIPTLRGGNYKNVAEAYFEKEHKVGNKASVPLTPEKLESKRSQLLDKNYRWLALSVWFGLRPIEVDLLRKPSGKKTWWIETVDGKQVLWIYQTKLKGVKPEKRVKYIPAITPEQDNALTFITPTIRRPLQKTMIRVFGDGFTLYGGRKGFTDLMKNFGQSFENTSAWLGHTSVVRTYQSYYNRHKVKWDKIA